MINLKEKLNNFKLKIKEKIINNKGKVYLLCIILLFILGFIVPIKFTYYWSLLEASLWSALFIFKEKICITHDETTLKTDTYFYKEWILNLCFITSIFYVFYLYMSGLALQFL